MSCIITGEDSSVQTFLSAHCNDLHILKAMILIITCTWGAKFHLYQSQTVMSYSVLKHAAVFRDVIWLGFTRRPICLFPWLKMANFLTDTNIGRFCEPTCMGVCTYEVISCHISGFYSCAQVHSGGCDVALGSSLLLCVNCFKSMITISVYFPATLNA